MHNMFVRGERKIKESTSIRAKAALQLGLKIEFTKNKLF